MITLEKLTKLIKQGEGLKLEFKKKDILSNITKLAREMVAFANTEGGRILIGINDEGNIEGMKGKEGHEAFLMNIARDKCSPPISPSFEIVETYKGDVYIVTILKFEHYPHALKTRSGRVYFVRVGSTVREPSSSKLQTLFIRSIVKTLSQKLIDLLKREVSDNLKLAKEFKQATSKPKLEVPNKFFQRDTWNLILVLQGEDIFRNNDAQNLCKNCYWRINQMNDLLQLRMEKGEDFRITVGKKSTRVDERILGVLPFLFKKLDQLDRRLNHIP